MALINKILSADVADDATVVVDYAAGMGFPLTTGHYVNIGGNIYDQADDEIGITLGDTSVTITNKTGRTWLQGEVLKVELVEPKNIKIVQITQTMYNALAVKDPETLYSIVSA